jgi:predicted NAD/FAD-binding protein
MLIRFCGINSRWFLFDLCAITTFQTRKQLGGKGETKYCAIKKHGALDAHGIILPYGEFINTTTAYI